MRMHIQENGAYELSSELSGTDSSSSKAELEWFGGIIVCGF